MNILDKKYNIKLATILLGASHMMVSNLQALMIPQKNANK
jgi:hypothetical protein